MIDNFVYDIANTKTYGHIMIALDDWLSDSMLLQINLKGNSIPTKITKVVKINPAPAYRPLPIKEGDVVAISNIATRVGLLKPFRLPDDPTDYAHVHLSQVLGYFKDGEIAINKFVPLYDKVVMKKIDVKASQFIDLSSDNMSVGKVIATGDGGFDEVWKRRPMLAEVDTIVLVRDNVSTSITIGGEEYYITEDKNIVGEFISNDYSFDNFKVFPDVNIFEEYEEDTLEGSFLLKPVYDKTDVDIAQTYQEVLFKLVISDKLEDGIYYISRFDTEYIKFKGKNYFVVDTNKIMAKRAVKGEK